MAITSTAAWLGEGTFARFLLSPPVLPGPWRSWRGVAWALGGLRTDVFCCSSGMPRRRNFSRRRGEVLVAYCFSG